MCNSALSSHQLASQFQRDTFEKVVFYATAQICIVYVISLMIAGYNFIVQTMQREKYVNVTDAGEMELSVSEYDDPEVPRSPSTPLENAIVFKNADELRKYIYTTHQFGLLLLVLIVALDYSHDWIAFVFLLGLCLRNVTGSLTRVNEHICDFLYKIWIFVLIVTTYAWLAYIIDFPTFTIQTYPITTPFISGVLFVSGVFWAQSPSVARRPITEVCLDAKGIILMMCVPAFVILYRADLFQDYHPSISDVVVVWIVQPIVKFLCVVIFVMSIRAGRLNELVLVNCATLVFDTLNRLSNDAIDTSPLKRIGCALLLSILCGAYVVRVLSIRCFEAPTSDETASAGPLQT